MTSRNKKQTFSEAIASTSTGKYYPSVAAWWDAIGTVCRAFNVQLTGECPQVYNDSGRLTVEINDNDRLFMTYYRMPSFNWEIVCYLT